LRDGALVTDPSGLVRTVSLIAGALVLASLTLDFAALQLSAGASEKLRRLFSLDTEGNVPTFFSTFLLLLAAMLLNVIARLTRRQSGSGIAGWRMLSWVFALGALDEASRVHELLSQPMRDAFPRMGPAFHYAWVIPGMAVAMVVGAAFLPFFLRLPRPTRSNFALAAALYLGGAIGMELVGGLYLGTGTAEIVGYTIEEGLEMAGMIVFMHSLLRYVAEHHPESRLVRAVPVSAGARERAARPSLSLPA
jgi:hypothetical protein